MSKLSEFRNKMYFTDKKMHDKPFGSAIRTLIQRLHHKLMDYKAPVEDYEYFQMVIDRYEKRTNRML